jgi:hypothetical protein
LPLVLLSFCAYGAPAQLLIPFEDAGHWGLRDSLNRIVVPAVFDEAGWTGHPPELINGVTGYRLGTRWGLVASGGRRITEALYSSIRPGEGNYFVASKELPGHVRPLAGTVTAQGKEVIPFKYDVLDFTGLRVIAAQIQSGHFLAGVLDVDGNVIIPLRYRTIVPLGSLRFSATRPDKRIDLYTDDGRLVLQSPIDSLSPFQHGRAVYQVAQRRGLIDREGRMVTKPVYAEVFVGENSAKGFRAAAWHVVTALNQTIDTLEGEEVRLAEGHVAVKFRSEWALYNRERRAVGDQAFEEVNENPGGTAIVKQQGKYGVIRNDGSWLLPPRFSHLIRHGTFYRTAETRQGREEWSLYGSLGIRLSEGAYDDMLPPQYGHYPVRKNGFWGLLDEFGRESVYCVFDTLHGFSPNLVAVGFRQKFGLIDYSGNWKLAPQPLLPHILDDTHYLEMAGTTSYVRRTDGNVIYFTENPILILPDRFTETLHDGRQRTYSFDGMIIPPPLAPEGTQEVYELREGLRGIKKDGRYGFVDSRGRLRIANRYEAIRSFDGGLAPVMIRGRWGFIDASDRIAIQPRFDEVSEFKPLAVVKRNNKYGLLDRSGATPLEPAYDSLYYSEGYFVLVKDGKLGLSTLEGRITLDPKYDYLQPAGGGYVIVGQGGKRGLVTREGLSTIPMAYDEVKYQASTDLYFCKKPGYWEEIR